jgi:hypothetical protein
LANLKLRCPACGAEIRLGEASQAAELQALDGAAVAFAGDWLLVKEYLDCFQGKKEMTVAKRLRLARELWEMWKDGRFSIGGAWYRIGREEFREALRTTCNQVAPGLTNHNYLKKVLVAAAEKTSQRQERELRAREESLRAGGLRTAGGDACATMPREDELPDDPEWRKEFLRLNRAVGRARTSEARAAAKAALEQHLEAALIASRPMI